MLFMLQFSDDVFTSVDLKYGSIVIRAKQPWNWRLAENEQNKITAEMLTVNIQSGDQTAPTLCCCCYWCFFCDLDATTDDSEGKKYH